MKKLELPGATQINSLTKLTALTEKETQEIGRVGFVFKGWMAWVPLLVVAAVDGRQLNLSLVMLLESRPLHRGVANIGGKTEIGVVMAVIMAIGIVRLIRIVITTGIPGRIVLTGRFHHQCKLLIPRTHSLGIGLRRS